MNFRENQESIETQIAEKLSEIEEKEHVKILHAVESGSRAWGFASPDSDYDVRFVYVRPMESYLRLEDQNDFIDWELNETLDINGWDLSKVLKHFHKSNATLFEWSNSPIVYRTTREWEEIRAVSQRYFSCKAAMYHYYGTANKNYHEYLQEEKVKYKKYFYVLRPIFACKWIEEKQCPPPVRFSELMDNLSDEAVINAVKDLLEKKIRMTESEKGPRVDLLNEYITESLQKYKQELSQTKDDREPEWGKLNAVFIKNVMNAI